MLDFSGKQPKIPGLAPSKLVGILTLATVFAIGCNNGMDEQSYHPDLQTDLIQADSAYLDTVDSNIQTDESHIPGLDLNDDIVPRDSSGSTDLSSRDDTDESEPEVTEDTEQSTDTPEFTDLLIDMSDTAPLLEPMPLCINEFVARNVASLITESLTPDWIELHNPTAGSINLDGWSLSDDRDEPHKHLMVGGLEIAPGGFLLLYPDSQEHLGPDHLGFNLAVEGEEVVLSAPDGRRSILSYGPLERDIAVSRTTGDCCTGEGCLSLTFGGSPGISNTTLTYDSETLFPKGSNWSYFDQGSLPAPSWMTGGYDDTGWDSGPAPLGYGDPHIVTTVGFGPDESDKFITTYFRTQFTITDLDSFDSFILGLMVDDAAAVYINGDELARINLPEGPIGYETYALTSINDASETTFNTWNVPVEGLLEGENLLAVEVHQVLSSSDIGLDVYLDGQSLLLPETGEWSGTRTDLVLLEEVGGLHDPSAWIFSQEYVHRIDLSITQANIDILNAYSGKSATQDPVYVPATFTLDGQTVETVGVRLRGTWGSFRDLSGKPKFRIDFNRYVEGQRFYGLKAMSLNNSIEDCSQIREVMGYQVFQEAGLAAPRATPTVIYINGNNYGLYVLLETEDDVLLERHYEDATGNLYDGKYTLTDECYACFLDFTEPLIYHYQLNEGIDVGSADLLGVANALLAPGRPNFYEDMGRVIDWDNFHRHVAAEQWSGHVDGYVSYDNNYRVYFDPTDGLMDWLTWDLDWTFRYEWEFGCGYDPGCNLLYSACWDNTTCMTNQQIAIEELVVHLETVDLSTQFQHLDEITYELALNDPRKECSDDSIRPYRNDISRWLRNRSDEIRAFWDF